MTKKRTLCILTFDVSDQKSKMVRDDSGCTKKHAVQDFSDRNYNRTYFELKLKSDCLKTCKFLIKPTLSFSNDAISCTFDLVILRLAAQSILNSI